MKNLFAVVLGFMLLCPVQTFAKDEAGNYTKNEIKKAEKSAKKQVKEQKKAGWEFNVSGDPVVIVTNHLLRTMDYGGEGRECVGNANEMKSISLGKSKAHMAAITQYVRDSRMAISGKINYVENDISGEQFDNFINAYEAKLAEEIKGEIKLSYVVYRKNVNGKYDVNAYCLIDEEGARRAKIRALKASAEMEKIALSIADEISSFVNDD